MRKAPGDVIGKPGDKLTLRVEFEGKPAPTVRWYKDDEEIFPGRNIAIMNKDAASVLTVQKLDQDNDGDYKVRILDYFPSLHIVLLDL